MDARNKMIVSVNLQKLDKTNYVPYYLQIKQIILERIKTGFYPPSSRIPSENVLSKEFDVSRLTIRKALEGLKQNGLLTSHRGRITRVSPQKIEQILPGFYSFGYEVGDTGITARSEIIRAGVVPAPASMSSIAQREPGFLVNEIVRLRHLESEPIVLEFSYVPDDIAPSLYKWINEHASLYEVLKTEYQKNIADIVEYLDPYIADDFEAGLLRIATGTPVFQTERISRDGQGVFLEYRKSLIRGDRFRFKAHLL
jgi:GntR family transcriptional regulator